MTSVSTTSWTKACSLDVLTIERGVAVLVGDTQIALFRTFDDSLFALDNIDPFMHAAVMSRGIVGTRGDEPTVASPLLKQVFSLRTGQCLDDESVSLATYPVRVVGGEVEIGVPASTAGA